MEQVIRSDRCSIKHKQLSKESKKDDYLAFFENQIESMDQILKIQEEKVEGKGPEELKRLQEMIEGYTKVLDGKKAEK